MAKVAIRFAESAIADLETYRGVRVLLLGGTGFIGRWVARLWSAEGAELHLLDGDHRLTDKIPEINRLFDGFLQDLAAG